MANTDKTVRKNFQMHRSLIPRLASYAEEYDFSQAQVINMALRQFFDNEDAKKVMQFSANPEALIETLFEYMEKKGYDLGDFKALEEGESS